MGHSYLGESPRCHIVGSTTLNILQQGWDCNRFLNCASGGKDVGKIRGVKKKEGKKTVSPSAAVSGVNGRAETRAAAAFLFTLSEARFKQSSQCVHPPPLHAVGEMIDF